MNNIFLNAPNWVDALGMGVMGTFLLTCWCVVVIGCALFVWKCVVGALQIVRRDISRLRGSA